ncbi:ketopantoate reductase family protein [Aspergillus homomorphus CBS 101889]|uniref:2-dehydropantoate 2-reductase n=1 Tax=Aspergillus homomorphus (strain CBS 101889) TaxID=1450537 RepID=A0A395I0F7_ASPHC|nr:2-dehydropantoate 2-reductase [Aspergillus homomorphus CBS 101889]RAL13113.1 2-dehydropantoate 2-reductase [Aspergillus homomorphus CBS 101889]
MASSPIHIVGLGSIGTFIAHSLRSLPTRPPVTLILHRAGLYDQYVAREGKLRVQIGESGPSTDQGGFGVELLGKDLAQQATDPIRCLVVTVKASATIAALRSIQHRLNRQSTICLLQNGLGQVEQLNEQLFPNPHTRPTYISGIMRLGVYLRSPFDAVLAGMTGSVTVGTVGGDANSSAEPAPSPSSSTRYLLDRLTESSILQCTESAWADLFQAQLLKLSANCVINPLTALLDVRNGALLNNLEVLPLQRQLLQEVSRVFQRLPALQDRPDAQQQFSFPSLEASLISVIQQTASNSSSMREDLRKGRATEIDFINGWVVQQGESLGVDCPANRTLRQLIRAKSNSAGTEGLAPL